MFQLFFYVSGCFINAWAINFLNNIIEDSKLFVLSIDIMKGKLEEDYTMYKLIPIHDRWDLADKCINLINSEWPRSDKAR